MAVPSAWTAYSAEVGAYVAPTTGASAWTAYSAEVTAWVAPAPTGVIPSPWTAYSAEVIAWVAPSPSGNLPSMWTGWSLEVTASTAVYFWFNGSTYVNVTPNVYFGAPGIPYTKAHG